MLQTRSKVHSIVPHLPGWHINLVQASREDYYTYTWMYLAQWIMTNTAPQQLVWLTCEWKTALPWSQVVATDSIQYVYYLYCRMLLGAVIPPTKGSALLSGPHKTQLISCSSWHLSISFIVLKSHHHHAVTQLLSLERQHLCCHQNWSLLYQELLRFAGVVLCWSIVH